MTLTARLLLPVLLAACTDRSVTAVPPRPSGEQRQEIPISTNRDIDILFVVNNSDSMGQEQRSLARNFPEFIRVLETIGDLPDLHLGVVSSDVGTAPHLVQQCEGQGDNGLLQIPPACQPLTDGSRYIADLDDPDSDGRLRNIDPSLTTAQQFACMAELGVGGCGFEQHFEAMRRALDGNPSNAGFLRDDAFLAVIFIQDEDDCSARDRDVFDPDDPALGPLSSFRCFEYGVRCQPDGDPRAIGPRQDCEPRDDSATIEDVQTYVDFLRQLKADPRRVIVAGIAGAAGPVSVAIDPAKPAELWTPPVCTVCPGGGSSCALGSALVSARPTVRLHALLDAFPQKSTFQDICAYDPALDDVDLSGALVQIAALLKRALGTPCIDGALADGDPSQDGIQPVCSVSDFVHLDQPDEQEHLLAACEGPLVCDSDVPDPPCYRFELRDDCGTETDLALTVDRCDTAPDDTTVVVRCLVE